MEDSKIAILMVYAGDNQENLFFAKLCLSKILEHTEYPHFKIFLWLNGQCARFLSWLNKNVHKDKIHIFSAHPREKLYHPHAIGLQRLFIESKRLQFELVLTLDSDSHPIVDGWLTKILEKMKNDSLVGIWRDELEPGITSYIHPSCMLAKSEDIDAFELRFDDVLLKSKDECQDTCFNFTHTYIENGLPIGSMKRSNKNNLHYIIGGIYGDLIYHQGGGSRSGLFFWNQERSEENRVANDVAYRSAYNALVKNYSSFINFLKGRDNISFSNMKNLHLMDNLFKLTQKICQRVKPNKKQFNLLFQRISKDVLFELPNGWNNTTPDFIGLGYPKCGTTLFYSLLEQHPMVAPNLVDHEALTSTPTKETMHLTWSDGVRDYKKLFASCGDSLSGEFSVLYIKNPTTMYQVNLLDKSCKYFVLLRNPIDRFYSHVNHLFNNRRKGLNIMGESESQLYLKHDIINQALYFSSYYNDIYNLLNLIDKERIHIVLFEEFVDDICKVLGDSYAFLNLPAFKNLKIDLSSKNEGNYLVDISDMPSRVVLKKYFQYDVDKLASIIEPSRLRLWRDFYE